MLLPGTVVALVAGALLWRLPDQLETITARYALVLYGVGAVLAAFFHRSRVLVALVGVAVVDLGRDAEPSAAASLLPLGTMLLAMLGVLALLRDRGVTSRAGLVQVAIGVAIAAGGYVVFNDASVVGAFSAVQLLPPGLPAMAALPQATLVIGAVSLLAGVYGALQWRGPVERAVVWAQLMLIVALLPALEPAQSGIMLMAGGLVLSLSVLEQTYSMAYRDELTGLPGRRALMHDLADMAGNTYTVAMVDVDHFKRFNDKHGHDVGDQVLRLVAAKLEGGPGGGKAYRYGGEEFTILYPGRERDDALPHADAVRASVERATFSLRSWNRPRKKPDQTKPKKKRRTRKLSVTVSLGLSDSSTKGASPEAVLKRADEALYRAKKDGRNRVSA